MKKQRNFTRTLQGGAVGAVNGLFGGGGGMIAVPLLLAGGLAPRAAHATAIAVILPVSVMSAAVYLFASPMPLGYLLPVCLGVSLGGYLGAKLLSEISAPYITLIFAFVMLSVGVRSALF